MFAEKVARKRARFWIQQVVFSLSEAAKPNSTFGSRGRTGAWNPGRRAAPAVLPGIASLSVSAIMGLSYLGLHLSLAVWDLWS